MVNTKILKQCESLLKVSNEIKKFVKSTIVKSHWWHWASFPNGNCNKIIKLKYDVVITNYGQISVKNTP